MLGGLSSSGLFGYTGPCRRALLFSIAFWELLFLLVIEIKLFAFFLLPCLHSCYLSFYVVFLYRRGFAFLVFVGTRSSFSFFIWCSLRFEAFLGYGLQERLSSHRPRGFRCILYVFVFSLRGQDSNLRSSGHGPDEFSLSLARILFSFQRINKTISVNPNGNSLCALAHTIKRWIGFSFRQLVSKPFFLDHDE